MAAQWLIRCWSLVLVVGKSISDCSEKIMARDMRILGYVQEF